MGGGERNLDTAQGKMEIYRIGTSGGFTLEAHSTDYQGRRRGSMEAQTLDHSIQLNPSNWLIS